MDFLIEKECRLPVIDQVDVLVAGGGPAGYAAALAAARHGAKTMLIEQQNCIGGMATAGMMSDFSPGTDSPYCREATRKMLEQESGYFDRTQTTSQMCINHEALKTAMLETLLEAGVALKLYTFASRPVMDGGRIRGIVIENKSGRSVIPAEVVIDCTGDGDIAARAGAEFTIGREDDGKCQPATLMFRIGGVDYKKAVFPGSFETRIDLPKGEIQTLGHQHLPFPAGHVLLYRTWIPGEVCVNMTNIIGIDGTCADDLARAELVCRKQMTDIIRFLREFVPGYETCYLVAAAQMIGVRETRHFKCLYQIGERDILEARVFDDWIAANNHFNFDIHSLNGPGLDRNGAQKFFHSAGKYTIPYRACVPEKIDGLLLAGRSISGTHKAHSNFRVMPICMNVGHGVGTAAALAVKGKILPRNVDAGDVQRLLQADGMSPAENK